MRSHSRKCGCLMLATSQPIRQSCVLNECLRGSYPGLNEPGVAFLLFFRPRAFRVRDFLLTVFSVTQAVMGRIGASSGDRRAPSRIVEWAWRCGLLCREEPSAKVIAL